MGVSADGRYVVNTVALTGRSVDDLTQALSAAATAGKDSVVIIHADAATAHQSVITVMEAARRSGLSQITFAAQSSGSAGQ